MWQVTHSLQSAYIGPTPSFLQAINGAIIAITSISFLKFFLQTYARAAPSRCEVNIEAFTRFQHQDDSVSSVLVPLLSETKSTAALA